MAVVHPSHPGAVSVVHTKQKWGKTHRKEKETSRKKWMDEQSVATVVMVVVMAVAAMAMPFVTMTMTMTATATATTVP